MKIFIICTGCAMCLFAMLFFNFNSRKLSSSSNPQDSPELTLMSRPDWVQWRAEGEGIAKYFRHILDYNKKSKRMVFNSFPGQKEFFANQKQLLANLPQPLELQDYVRVGFVGDLMEFSNPDEQFITPEILTTLQGMDFVLGNLEVPISQSSSISKFRNFLSQFNAPPSYLNALSINGKPVFQFLSLANNHILDRGDVGVQETIENLEAKGIQVHGADQKKFAVFTSKGIRFGVSTSTWGVNPQIFQDDIKSPIWYLPGIAPLDQTKIDLTRLKDALTEMDNEGIDFKIIFLHWGFEFEAFPDPLIQEIGRTLIHSGADLVIGSHPHMLQPFELVQTDDHNGLIAYSMGNFITSMSNPFTRIGLIQELKVWRNEHNTIKWSLGSSQLTQVTDGAHPQIEFLGTTQMNDVADAGEYYKKSLNLPFLNSTH